MKKKMRIILVAITCVLLLTALAAATFFISRSRSFQFFGGLVNHVETEQKLVALTFDDGPTEFTGEILQTLEERNVKATFFLIGSQIEDNPQWARQIADAGHELGNHSYSHRRMVFHRYGWIAGEIVRTDELIRESGYDGEILFRPPNGKKLVLLPLYLRNHGRKTILWTLEPNSDAETNTSAEGIVQSVLENVRPGSIVLLHPMYEKAGATSRDALPGIVDGLRAQGYDFVTLSELLAQGEDRVAAP